MDSKFHIGQTLELTIDSLTFHGGRGVARHEGVVVFVPWAVPGDRLRVTLTEIKPKFLVADLSEVLVPSTFRRAAPCPVFGKCGGCTWQQVEYSEQLVQKQKILESALKLLRRNQEFEILPIIPSAKEFGYRNRIQVQKVEGQIGFFARGSHTLVSTSTCAIAEPFISEQIPSLGNQPDGRYEISRQTDDRVIIEAGSRSAETALFSQVNTGQNTNLIDVLLKWAKFADWTAIWDLYCGSGNLTWPLARAFPKAQITGVELSASSIRRAKEKPTQINWQAADVAQFLKLQKTAAETLIVLDPPRMGLEKQALEEILRLGPKGLLYVSCDPMTFARDAAQLILGGHRLLRVQGLDMFPQTEHVELVGLFSSALSI